MHPIDDRYLYLAEQAKEQCEQILEAFDRIELPEDESQEPETLQGVTRTPPPIDRAALVFQSNETPDQRTLVFIDAILDLALLINRERIV